MTVSREPAMRTGAPAQKDDPARLAGEPLQSDFTTEEVMTTLQAARLLKRRPETLRRWRTTGGGPPWVRVGSTPRARCLYLRRHINAWLEAHTFTSTADETVRASGNGR